MVVSGKCGSRNRKRESAIMGREQNSDLIPSQVAEVVFVQVVVDRTLMANVKRERALLIVDLDGICHITPGAFSENLRKYGDAFD